MEVINKSKIGLDLQEVYSPLAHRMFEYSACGTPVITRDRPEVYRVFEKDKEILTYRNYEDLKKKLDYYLSHPKELKQIGLNTQQKCIKEHNITHRVDNILEFIRKNICQKK